MTCSKHQSIIDEIGRIDRLPPASARHVDECPACRDFAANLVALRELLREPARVTAPPDFDVRLARRLRDVRSARESAPWYAWLAVPRHTLATAAAVALVAVGTFTAHRYESSVPVAPVQVATNPTLTNSVTVPEPVRGASTMDTPAGPLTGEASPSSVEVSAPVRNVSFKNSATVARVRTSERTAVLIQDADGARVVDVPAFLIGAERIVPARATVPSIGSADDRMAF